MENEKRKLIKFGNYSLCITLPKQVISEMKLKKGGSVSLTYDKSHSRLIVSFGSDKAKTTKSSPINEPNTKSRW